jgi:predicted transcriptional regulator
MLLPSLETIKQKREQLHISQKKLAAMTGVSTSMINQIESGTSKPSYQTAKKIFENLAKLEGQSSSHIAGEICKSPIIKMKITQTVNEAIKKMNGLAISQIPIFDGAEPVGIVSEEGLARQQLAVSNISQWKKTPLKDVMTSVPPIINYDTPANTLGPLLEFTKCILVSKNSKTIGIITATDTLKMI